jgi:nitrite reductase (NADH) small subunit
MTSESPSAAQEVRVGSLAAVRAGEPVLADVDGTEIALFLCHDTVIATQGQCPHAEGPLHEGEVDDCTLTCPWHGWTFNLVSGVCNEDESIVLEKYPVRIEGDDILVML